jgi:hypothetical protein
MPTRLDRVTPGRTRQAESSATPRSREGRRVGGIEALTQCFQRRAEQTRDLRLTEPEPLADLGLCALVEEAPVDDRPAPFVELGDRSFGIDPVRRRARPLVDER